VGVIGEISAHMKLLSHFRAASGTSGKCYPTGQLMHLLSDRFVRQPPRLRGKRSSVAALRERGVKAPAQAVYTLQLAGYATDRVSCKPLADTRHSDIPSPRCPNPTAPPACMKWVAIAPDATDAAR
jgi:hypothetical protein